LITAYHSRPSPLARLPGRGGPERPAAILPLIAVLRQLEDLLRGLTDEQYATKPVGVVPSSIGGHVRHCLDHVDALLGGIDHAALTYDQRRRGTEIETSRAAALEALRRQENELRALPAYPESLPLRLSVLVSNSLPAVEVDTSFGRELAFVLSHTIHHNAQIGAMARTLGVTIPQHFGYAPATIAHLEGSACAR
jgi:uncharacterized damage-inducible protein DinB